MNRTGLRNNARSPSSISNIEHNDGAGAKKVLVGTGSSFSEIIADSSVETPISRRSSLRVANTTGSVQYVFIGLQSEAPAGAPAAATGLAVMPNSVEMFYADDTDEVMVIKSSDSGVQIAKLSA